VLLRRFRTAFRAVATLLVSRCDFRLLPE